VENRVNPLKSKKSKEQITKEIKKTIEKTGAEVIVSYLPVGSEKATQFWAQICLDTNTAFVTASRHLSHQTKNGDKNLQTKSCQ
jgi:myo-inositol-1-phosphate synthase